MPPRTRRARMIAERIHTVETLANGNSTHLETPTDSNTDTQRGVVSRDIDSAETSANPPGRKRTISSVDGRVPTETAGPATSNARPTIAAPPASVASAASSVIVPTKRPRHIGPIRCCPMQLDLTTEGSGDDQGATDGHEEPVRKRPGLHRTFSFYPGRAADVRHAPESSIDPIPNFSSDNSDAELEEDWIDEQHLTNLAEKQPSRFQVAISMERASWDVSGATSGPSAVTSSSGQPVSNSSNEPEQRSAGNTTRNTGRPMDTWPAETDLLFVPGTTRVALSVQVPLVRLVIQDAFENLRASLLFADAFPNPMTVLTYIRHALRIAAEGHLPVAIDIHRRLLDDDSYMAQMSRLPRARIPLFRGEVRERCATIISPHFLAMGSANERSQYVKRQLVRYNYTFPSGLNNGHVMHMRPYQNDRIITVIRDLYFTGGSTSIASRFHNHFLTSEDSNGVMRREVPIAMVALVATVLFAALNEWRMGEHHGVEFSASAFLDVYEGHVNTFLHIRQNHEAAYHSMMTDIYMQASLPATRVTSRGSIIADLVIENLDA